MDTEQHAGGMIRRRNIEGDRLSSLPNDVIHKILSFVSTKKAIQASTLSSSWRFIWTSLPYLSFSRKDFDTLPKFNSFVTHVLSRRNNQAEVSSIKLSGFHGDITQELIKKVTDYAFSHNVQQLTITSFDDPRRILEFPLSPSLITLKHLTLQLAFTDGVLDLYICHPHMQIIDHKIFGLLQKTHNVQQMTIRCLYGLHRWDSVFTSCWQSLKHLTLVGYTKSASVILPSNWDLPVLTTLDLKDVRIAGECTLFSKCVNLKSLIMSNFDMADETNIATICHPQLSNITLEDGTWRSEYLHVVTPQLKNLTVINCDGELLISAPDQLTTLKYKSNHTLQLVFTDGALPSLEKADLYIRNPHIRIAHRIFGLFQKLHNVINLTLNLEIIEVLFSAVELISIKCPPPLVNLKSFNIYPLNANLAREAQKMLNASTKLKSYLMDGSPNGSALP